MGGRARGHSHTCTDHRALARLPGLRASERELAPGDQTQPQLAAPPLHAVHLCVHLSVWPFAHASTYVFLCPSIPPCHPAGCLFHSLQTGWSRPLAAVVTSSWGLFLSFQVQPTRLLSGALAESGGGAEKSPRLLPAWKALLSTVPWGWTHTPHSSPPWARSVLPRALVVALLPGGRVCEWDREGQEEGAGAGVGWHRGQDPREGPSLWRDSPFLLTSSGERGA